MLPVAFEPRVSSHLPLPTEQTQTMPDLLPTEQTQTMQDNIESQSQYQDGQFPYCESIDCPQEQEPQRPQIAEASVAVGSEARHPSYESPLCRGWSVSPITKRMSPQMEAWLEKEMAEFMGMGGRSQFGRH